jgi:hypothetical protein
MRIPHLSVVLAVAVVTCAACSDDGERESASRESRPDRDAASGNAAPVASDLTNLKQRRPPGWTKGDVRPPKDERPPQEDATPRDAARYPGAHGGLFRYARKTEIEITAEDRKKMEELRAIPYLSGYVEASGESNVTLYDPEIAYNGYNLYNSGHYPEATLIDMDGRVLHQWSLDIEEVWPDATRRKMSYYWRRVHLYPNGDLLAIFDSYGLIKLDHDSKLLWSYTRRCHHDLEITEDGSIYVLYRDPTILKGYNNDEPVLPDGIVVLSHEGKHIREYWLLDCFKNSEYKYMLKWIPRNVTDVFHANSIRVFDGSMEGVSPLYKKGNMLVALRKIDVVAIVDPDTESVVWATSGIENGLWHKHHDPTLLANGNMLVFDNRGRGRVEATKIIEFDPFTLDVAWVYPGAAGEGLYSRTMGACRRLPNGNTLISESNYGRAVEVTPDKKIAWEFVSPHRAGENDELIATLFQVSRLDYDYVQFLGDKPASPGE